MAFPLRGPSQIIYWNCQNLQNLQQHTLYKDLAKHCLLSFSAQNSSFLSTYFLYTLGAILLCWVQATDNINPTFQSPIWSANQAASHTSPLSRRYSRVRSVVHTRPSPSLVISMLMLSWYLGIILLSVNRERKNDKCKRERERHTETDRQTNRQTDRQTDEQTDSRREKII